MHNLPIKGSFYRYLNLPNHSKFKEFQTIFIRILFSSVFIIWLFIIPFWEIQLFIEIYVTSQTVKLTFNFHIDTATACTEIWYYTVKWTLGLQILVSTLVLGTVIATFLYIQFLSLNTSI